MTDANIRRHNQLFRSMQRFRGALYLEEGALTPDQLDEDGRHWQAVDEKAWHILAVDEECEGGEGEVVGCARYMAHENTVSYSDLGVGDCDLAKSSEWGGRLRAAVEADIARARALKIAYVEVGGWAIAPKVRNTAQALRIALAAYSLSRLLGGCVGIGTVTQRHLSSSILRRLGGQSLVSQGVELPSYFDSSYGCQMEVLRFESAAPNPRFEMWVRELEGYLKTVEVFSNPFLAEHSLLNLQLAMAGTRQKQEGLWIRRKSMFV